MKRIKLFRYTFYFSSRMLLWENVLAKLKGFQRLTSTDDALRTWFKVLQVKKLGDITIPLDQGLNRVLAEDVVAEENLPKFDRSAVDGYALKAENTTGASQFKPAFYQLTNSTEADLKQPKQVWTGNPIPKNVDAVVMIE